MGDEIEVTDWDVTDSSGFEVLRLRTASGAVVTLTREAAEGTDPPWEVLPDESERN